MTVMISTRTVHFMDDLSQLYQFFVKISERAGLRCKGGGILQVLLALSGKATLKPDCESRWEDWAKMRRSPEIIVELCR